MLRKWSKTAKIQYRIWQIFFVVSAAITSATFLLIANFPNKYENPATISLLQYAIEWNRFDLLAATIGVLALACAGILLSRARKWQYIWIGLVAAAIVGYCYMIGAVGQIGTEDGQIAQWATYWQVFFFFILAPTQIFAAIAHALTRPTPGQYEGLISVRNFIFPQFSEISYVTLLATFLTFLALNPDYFFAIFNEGGKVKIVYFAIALYLFFRMFSKKPLSHEGKMWTALIYYGALGLLSALALFAQLDANSHTGSIYEKFNFSVTVFMLIVSATRGIGAMIIFRADNGQIGKIIADRFSSVQHRVLELVLACAAAAAILLYLRTVYENPTVLILLTFTYTSILTQVLLKRVPILIHAAK